MQREERNCEREKVSGEGERSRDLSIPLAALGNEEEREMGSSEGGARGEDKGNRGDGVSWR